MDRRSNLISIVCLYLFKQMFMMIIYITDFYGVGVCCFFFPLLEMICIFMRYIYVQFAFNGLMTELHCLFFCTHSRVCL